MGLYTSLAFDASGRAYISYYDFSHTALKCAFWNGSSWVTQTVDNTGDVGGYTSIAIDPSGRPHISYYDFTNGDLKHAYLPAALPPLLTSRSLKSE